MKVVIAANFRIPHGAASAPSARNLALGFRECGADVHIMSTAPRVRPNGATRSHAARVLDLAAPPREGRLL